MPRKPSPEGPKWNFYVERDSVYKHRYVKASYCRWDVEKQQPRTAARVHVGRLFDDGSVRPGKTFLEKFPEYAGRDLYYFENRLYDRDDYLKAVPSSMEPDPVTEDNGQTEVSEPAGRNLLEDDWRAISRQYGHTHAAWKHVRQSGMLEDLERVFESKEDARLLAALAVYELCSPGSAPEDFSSWLGGVCLGPEVEPADDWRIEGLLSRISSALTNSYFRARLERCLAMPGRESDVVPSIVAFDSTAVSECCRTGEDDWAGVVSGTPGLRLNHLVVAFDGKTGEVVHAREYAEFPDLPATLERVFDGIEEAGISAGNVSLITNRGGLAILNKGTEGGLVRKAFSGGDSDGVGLGDDVFLRRAKFESGYRIFKCSVDCDACGSQEYSKEGKLLIFALATSLRFRMEAAMRSAAEKAGCPAAGDSLDAVLTELAKVSVRRSAGALRWKPNQISKKQRECFAVLGVNPPPGTIRY